MSQIRAAAVAGRFYPADARRLQADVEEYLGAAAVTADAAPQAIIAPHAGYPYSGPIAGTAYAYVAQRREPFTRVILLGPAHWVRVDGIAASSAPAFATPLGSVPVDQEAVARAVARPQVHIHDEAHAPEHALEVQLPFLQTVGGQFAIVPLLVGDVDAEEVAAVIDALWEDGETLVVVSSDLSHYRDYETAQRMDRATAAAIERLEAAQIGRDSACGRVAIRGLLQVARRRGLQASTVDLRSSGDTAGSRDRVVGYGAFLFYAPK